MYRSISCIIGLIGSFHTAVDDNEGKDLEKILRICEEKLDPILQGIIQGSPIPQFVIDKDHKVIFWNKALEKYSGIKVEDILGTDQQWRAFYKNKRPCMADLLVDEAVGEIPKWYAGKYSESGLISGAYAAIDFFPELGENGKWLYFTATAIKDRKGSIIGAVETLDDITERKLAEEQLQEAKRQADVYLELMGHDINNMNQVGIGYLELAFKEPGLSEAAKRAIEKALGALRDSSKLINNVEKLQRASMGKMKVEKIDLVRTLSDVRARFLGLGMPSKAVTINYIPEEECPAKECFVWANELLTDVFSNIVENAIKHSRGPVTITIKLGEMTRDGQDYYKVAIDDNGPGIPDELKKRLFTRFQRGETRALGKGLGLYLVKSLVESYGGRVWAEDRVQGDPGKGSRFVVMLPSA